MQRKLNEEFIREYSEQFSEKITSDFFASNDTITGKDILKVTPSKQVNFFILMILFGKWQEEMKKLQSPFFNYKSSEVRQAMVDFMNTLSQHIEVEEDHFVLLLDEAVQKTLILLTAPEVFLQREFDAKNISIVTEKITRPIFKYLKIYESHLGRFLTENAGEELDNFISNAEEYFSELDLTGEIEAELDRLTEVIPISSERLLKGDEQKEKMIVDEEGLPPVDDEELSEEEYPLDFTSEEESLNEKFSSPQMTTVNEKFSNNERKITIADQMQKRKVTNIMEAISVNHRYMFTKELFDGDREAFDEAINQVEECRSFDDAVELLVQNFAKERDWDMNSDEVKELLKMVFRKFR